MEMERVSAILECEVMMKFGFLVTVGAQKVCFSSDLPSSCSWDNNQINRGRLTGEHVHSLLYACTFGGDMSK